MLLLLRVISGGVLKEKYSIKDQTLDLVYTSMHNNTCITLPVLFVISRRKICLVLYSSKDFYTVS